MKQFKTIFKFEMRSYLANKIFVGVTLFLVAVITVVMFLPRISEFFKGENSASGNESKDVIILYAEDEQQLPVIEQTFTAAFPEYEIKLSDTSPEDIKEEIISGKATCAFVITGNSSYSYYVNNLSLYDSNTAIADEAMQSVYRLNMMIENGISADVAQQILTTPITHETLSLGKDQTQNFFYTYIMIFALYMVILMYGQMVATNVATEKSSRAMEVLITSARPVSMMFGKVMASCIAGLLQLVTVFGSAYLFYNINKSYWKDTQIINSIFDMPLELLIYMLIFFILGFFIYAFLYGAIGSTASKLEDINTSVMPVTMLFVIAFVVVMISMSNGTVDSALMRVCSYIPFTSPMAMFTRIAMSTVPLYEIIISITVLILSVIGVGVISAKIYRIGVLLYGTPPKIGAILKAIKKS